MTSYDIWKVCFIILFIIAVMFGLMKVGATSPLNTSFINDFKIIQMILV